MNFSINSFGKFITVVLVSIFFIFIFLFNELYTQTRALREVKSNKNLMIQKADELRQSSDDLTKFARAYAITSKIEYRNNYYQVLNIRSAKAVKPKYYNRIYWDLLEPIRSMRHPDGEKISLLQEMEELPFLPSQLKKLKLAHENSNNLVYLELEAFKAMDEKKQNKAIKLLYSKKYFEEKQKIMLPIDEFLFSIQEDTQSEIDEYNIQIDTLFNRIFFLILFGLFIFSFSLFVLRRKVLIPIDYLTRAILSFKTGGTQPNQKEFYDDEIGMMSKQFYSMKKKLDEKYEAVKKLSLTDPLTGIRNRRSFFEVSEEYMKLSLRHAKPISLMILDIDYFKKINDTYGHIIGDEILKFLTKTVQIALRDSDIYARYGGEEFVVLLPDTELEGSLMVANKIRSIVQDTPYRDSKLSISITVSIGVKQLTSEKLLRELIHHADEALYRAKENGRNRVESSS